MQSNKKIGNFFSNKKVALGQYLIALFEHKKALPHDCTFPGR